VLDAADERDHELEEILHRDIASSFDLLAGALRSVNSCDNAVFYPRSFNVAVAKAVVKLATYASALIARFPMVVDFVFVAFAQAAAAVLTRDLGDLSCACSVVEHVLATSYVVTNPSASRMPEADGLHERNSEDMHVRTPIRSATQTFILLVMKMLEHTSLLSTSTKVDGVEISIRLRTAVTKSCVAAGVPELCSDWLKAVPTATPSDIPSPSLLGVNSAALDVVAKLVERLTNSRFTDVCAATPSMQFALDVFQLHLCEDVRGMRNQAISYNRLRSIIMRRFRDLSLVIHPDKARQLYQDAPFVSKLTEAYQVWGAAKDVLVSFLEDNTPDDTSKASISLDTYFTIPLFRSLEDGNDDAETEIDVISSVSEIFSHVCNQYHVHVCASCERGEMTLC